MAATCHAMAGLRKSCARRLLIRHRLQRRCLQGKLGRDRLIHDCKRASKRLHRDQCAVLCPLQCHVEGSKFGRSLREY